MKKKMFMTIGAMVIAGVIGLLFSQSLFASADPDMTDREIEEKVESQYPGKIVELELEQEGTNPVYEIELAMEGQEYELQIDGNSGEVIRLNEKLTAATEEEGDSSLEITEKEISPKHKTAKEPEQPKEEEVNPSEQAEEENKPSENETHERNTFISKEEAIQIAQEQFAGEVDDVELEKEDGRLIYEIEIESSRGEAEFEIDAFTGEVLVVDIDLEDD